MINEYSVKIYSIEGYLVPSCTALCVNHCLISILPWVIQLGDQVVSNLIPKRLNNCTKIHGKFLKIISCPSIIVVIKFHHPGPDVLNSVQVLGIRRPLYFRDFTTPQVFIGRARSMVWSVAVLKYRQTTIGPLNSKVGLNLRENLKVIFRRIHFNILFPPNRAKSFPWIVYHSVEHPGRKLTAPADKAIGKVSVT